MPAPPEARLIELQEDLELAYRQLLAIKTKIDKKSVTPFIETNCKMDARIALESLASAWGNPRLGQRALDLWAVAAKLRSTLRPGAKKKGKSFLYYSDFCSAIRIKENITEIITELDALTLP